MTKKTKPPGFGERRGDGQACHNSQVHPSLAQPTVPVEREGHYE